ncbi:NUDIX domain-containing protein [Candidatus Saccharibacteria bacterium]|nr:NUDIX domain-containing protein [Candidatus Saccharibacteria bacterium]
MQPDLRTSFNYDSQNIIADWYTVTDKSQIPDLPWQQVYAIGNLNGQVPLITSLTCEKEFNLPGGRTEPGETIEQTITREMTEECNMPVTEWQPLGYQHLTEPDGKQIFQFRVYAKLEKIGEFVNDPGGGVIKNTMVYLSQVNSLIKYSEIGERMVKLAKKYFTDERRYLEK